MAEQDRRYGSPAAGFGAHGPNTDRADGSAEARPAEARPAETRPTDFGAADAGAAGAGTADARPPWHAEPVAAVLAAIGARSDGLSTDEAAARRRRYGPNRLPEAKRAGPLIRFLRQFNNLLIYVLMAAAVLTAALGHWVDTVVIAAVVVVNAIIGFVQEGKAERALGAIRDMLAPNATVLRDGQRRTLPAEEIVPGDTVIVEAGDRVPADLRLTTVRGLAAQEAVLTGESVPVDKRTDPVAAEAPLGDRRGMAFSGTLITAGRATGVAVATGATTELGRISALIAEVPATTTPLLQAMERFAKVLTGAVLAVAAAILGIGLTLGDYGFTELFMAVVGLSVAAIPEGLPAILTVTLAIGVQAMARRNAIVRRLPAIEALGSVSVICSDKTGTLTLNEMMVAGLALPGRQVTVTGSGYAPIGTFEASADGAADGQSVVDGAAEREVLDPADQPHLLDLARAALLCSEAELVRNGPPGSTVPGGGGSDGAGEIWTVTGDPMEGALLTLAAKAGLDIGHERKARPQTDSIPFDSRHRFMATLHHDHDGGAAIYVKGAPERLLAMADRQIAAEGGTAPLDAAAWHRRAEAMAAAGQRVLAIAMKSVPGHRADLSFDDVEGGLTLLGLTGMIDPPRPEAISAVAACRAAGIRVKMITGDHAVTAQAIARQLGLDSVGTVMQGSEIDGLDDATLRRRAAEVDVFARTSPEHKLRLVRALQEAGSVVAMTGDGVNDAPALKRADIGIAMGRKGTEAAKEAAEIVLADDNFATIAAAVTAGRTVYDNLRKAITFLLPVNGGESLSLIAALMLGLTLPITPLQILWVNMVSSVVLAMTLAFEPAEPGVMRRAPRPRDEPLLSGFVLWRVGFVSLLFCAGIFGMFTWARSQGASVEEARTIAVNTLVVMEIFYLFSVRYFHQSSLTLRGVLGTPSVLIAISAVTVLQFLFTYAPVMGAVFETQPVTILQGLQVVAVGVAVLLVLEVEKLCVRRLHAARRAARQVEARAGGG